MERTWLPGPIQAVAWNADCSSIAVSHCGNEVVIYEASPASSSTGGSLSWSKVASLEGHHQMVSGLDWAPRADLILSCSHDRDAFVWTRTAAGASSSGNAGAAPSASASPAPSPAGSRTPVGVAGTPGGRVGGAGGPGARPGSGSARSGGTSTSSTGGGAGSGGWEKQMVITRLTKGALCVRWSPSEAKFAIGSVARVVSVGYYDPESKWWACKLIRKAHESSVVSVAWHPNSVILATGSTDRRVRLFNAYVPGYEPEAAPGTVPPNSNFGDCLVEVSHEGCSWVHAVEWSWGDEALLYTSHDAAVGYVRGPQAQVVVRLSGACSLPLKCLAAVSERVAVGAGWEGSLVVLTRRSVQDPWQQAAVLGGPGTPPAAAAPGAGASTPGGGPATPGSVVRQLAQMHVGSGAAAAGAGSRAGGASGVSGQLCCHTACITGLHVRRPSKEKGVSGPQWHVASAGLDGQVVLWDLSTFL